MEYSRGVLVYHLGGSTFEISVHKVDGGSFDTISSIYDQHLGGNDFNQRVVDHLLLAHKNKTDQDLYGDDMFLLRLESEVEKAKRVLSVQDRVRIEIESLHPGGQGFSEQLTRSQFEDLNMDLFTKTITAIDQAIKDSVVYTKDDIQDIVFSGGSANIPFLQSAVREYFGRHKKYHGSSHPETTVVLGAAKLRHWYQDERHHDGDVCCFGEERRTLGIETASGAMSKYTDWNSGLNINKMYTFSTAMDNQDRVVIRVFSGDRTWTNQNKLLGGIEFTGIAPAPRGVPQIRVRLTTHSCGHYIHLSVMDVATGRINATIFSPWSRFNDYGEKIEYGMLEGGAFELEPAGKLKLFLVEKF
ncbi:ATPase with role in protein import into the ER [Mortierella sp. GBA35]|nr:ATPase with role in protein import into the ER [Mortierella sp. GBA35]